MIAADFFSGLGGFSEGARQAGVRVELAANHWSEAVHWHAKNHPSAAHFEQDLQQFDMAQLPDLSEGLLLAAPACQGHSQNAQPARKGRGGSHAPDAAVAAKRTHLQRSTAWAVVSAAELARPAAIVVENVPEFAAWCLFPSWCQVLRDLGYELRTHLLNARDFGSAQDRVRLILTASLGRAIEIEPTTHSNFALRLGDCLDLNPALNEHRWSWIADKSDRMQSRMGKAQKAAGSICVWNNVSESTGRPMDGLAPTLTTKSGSQLYMLDGPKCRILNPRELARIQGFPEEYQLPPQRGLAGHLIGNAIDVRLAQAVCAQVQGAMA